jgi:HSP20 family protein
MSGIYFDIAQVIKNEIIGIRIREIYKVKEIIVMTILKYSKRPNDFFTNQLMNQLFRETQDSFKNAVQREFNSSPATNVIEDDERYLLEMSIPGFSKEDVSVKVENALIKISAEKKSEHTTQKYLRQEFGVLKFERSFKLADSINQQAISAEVKNGVLKISLPKIEKKEPEIKYVEVR